MELGTKWSKPVDLDVLDLITLKRFIEPSREVPKLIWDINKAKSQSDYYEFEILCEDSQRFYNELTECSICNIEVPIPFINMHENSKKHVMNLKIINIALKRMADHNIATRHDYHQTNINFCGVCSQVVKDNEKDHETSNEHQLSMKHDSLLETFLSAYEGKMIKFNDIKRKLKIIRQYYANISNKMNVHSIQLINENTLQIISMVGTFSFDVNNFHGLSSVGGHLQCILCSVPVDDVQTHIDNDLHIERITTSITNNCNRKIDELRHHCVACNEILHNVRDHILEQRHEKMFSDAYIRKEYCDICGCYVVGDIETHNNGMRHKMKASHVDSVKDIKYHMQFDKMNGRYVCRICHGIILNEDEANNHVISQDHLTAYQELMTKNAIFPKEDRLCCSACDLYIIEEFVLSHIFNKKHRGNLVYLATEFKSEAYMFDTIVPKAIDEGVWFKCKMCYSRIRYDYLEEHLNNRSHNDKYQTFLAYNQLRKRNGHYYCEKCEESVPMKTEIDHVGQIKHVEKMKEPLSWRVRREPENVTYNTAIRNRYNKDENVTKTASASHVNSKDKVSPNVEACTSKAKESNIDDNDTVFSSNDINNAGTGVNAAANVDNKRLSCHLKLNTVTADTKVSYQTLMKMNKITLLLDNTYRCGICDVIINFNEAFIKEHIIIDTMHHIRIASLCGDDNSLDLLNKQLRSKKKKNIDASLEKNTSKANNISNSDCVTGEIISGSPKRLFKTNNTDKNIYGNSLINRNGTTTPDLDDDGKGVIIREDCLFCTICEVYIIGDEDVARNAHLNSEKHISKSTGFENNKEILAEQSESKNEEIEKKELSLAHFCKICRVNVPIGETNIFMHNKGKKHNINLGKILSDNLAIKNVDGRLFCDYCRIEIENNDLVDHLSSVVHGAAILKLNNQNEIIHSECKIDKADVRLNNLNASTSSAVIKQISENEPKTIFCKYCKVEVPLRSNLFKEHIEGKKHKKMRNRFLNINKIGSCDGKYHCTVCNETFEFGEEIAHVNKNSHVLLDNGPNDLTYNKDNTLIHTKEQCKVTDKKSDQDMIAVDNNGNMSCKLCDVNGELLLDNTYNGNPIIFEHILEHSDEILSHNTSPHGKPSAICCQVCNKMLPLDILNLEIHENSRSHKKKLNKIIADNAIRVRDDKICFCEKCDLYFNKISALKHIRSATHRKNAPHSIRQF